MARPHAVVVTMSQPFHGRADEFSNVWHYVSDATVVPTTAGWEELADAVVAAMRALFPNVVTFKRVRVHGPTDGTQAEDVMKVVKDLTGTGSALPQSTMFPESVLTVDRYVGRGPKGGKQFLRKFFHLGGVTHSGATQAQAMGTNALSTANKDHYRALINAFNTINIGAGTNRICTPNGKEPPSGEPWDVANYISTRQFKRGRKEGP